MERVVGVTTVGVCAQGVRNLHAATPGAGILGGAAKIDKKDDEETAAQEAWHYVCLGDHICMNKGEAMKSLWETKMG